MELMVLGNGQADQMLHRDFDSWYYFKRSREFNTLFSANIAMCDFSSTNGATVVVPGSTLWPDDRKARDDEKCLATMTKGSALLYSGDVLNGGGSNTEDVMRTGFYIGYIPSWLHGLENHMVSNGPGVVEQFDEDVQALLDKVPEGFTVVP
jgi:ectoine hydroxylase-related dioxygenase (phytanoyl-CoA dioxygenase family)